MQGITRGPAQRCCIFEYLDSGAHSPAGEDHGLLGDYVPPLVYIQVVLWGASWSRWLWLQPISLPGTHCTGPHLELGLLPHLCWRG